MIAEKKVRVQHGEHGTDVLTLEECTSRTFKLVLDVKAAKQEYLRTSVRLGWFLLQVKDELRHGQFEMWLSGAPVHRKVADRCMRWARNFGDRFGEVDRRRLFQVLNRAEPEAFPSYESFDEDRANITDRRINRALSTQNKGEGASPVVSRIAQMGGNGDFWGGDTSLEMGMNNRTACVPASRVADADGQGVLSFFGPMVKELGELARTFNVADDPRRARAEQIVRDCADKLRALNRSGLPRDLRSCV